MLISLQLFVQGDDLLPQSITEQLGISPGHAYAMGEEWTTGQGAIRLRPTGLWKWGISKEHDDPDLTLIVKNFCQAIAHQAGNIREIPGVERAWIDIFICKEVAEGESSDVAFNLDSVSLKELSKLNLPMEFTTGTVKAKN
jgi:hypothetical protein